LRKAARDLSEYDIAHVNFHHYYYAFFTPIIRQKVKFFYITFYGSDFNHSNSYWHYLNKKSTDIADKIFVTENPDFLTKIAAKYKIMDVPGKTGVLFPLMIAFELFETFSKNPLHLNSKTVLGITAKRLMVCGYNASPIVQHEEIIKVLVKLKEHLNDYTIAFPMTYGQQCNITRPRVKSLLKNSGLDYLVMEEFLPNEKLLALRFAADIFVHIQSRDQMASSLLEHLAAGTVVITGKWLPYDSLKESGVYFIQIDKIQDLQDALLATLENLDVHLQKCKKNKEIILGLVNWEKNKWSWYEAYNLNEK
jgi:glycosyltransferase involved in cell wall biosynthesis